MLEERRRELASIFRGARSREELETLIEGLLTPQEIEAVTSRWRLMTRLLRGDTQREISRELGVSLGSLARGSRLLQYGPQEFRALVERLEREMQEMGKDGAA